MVQTIQCFRYNYVADTLQFTSKNGTRNFPPPPPQLTPLEPNVLWLPVYMRLWNDLALLFAVFFRVDILVLITHTWTLSEVGSAQPCVTAPTSLWSRPLGNGTDVDLPDLVRRGIVGACLDSISDIDHSIPAYEIRY